MFRRRRRIQMKYQCVSSFLPCLGVIGLCYYLKLRPNAVDLAQLRLPPGFIDIDVTQLGSHELSRGSFMVKAIEVFEIASGSC
jgi:hypothetical protein